MTDNNFNRQLLTRFIQSECIRQLFLDLGQAYPNQWFNPNREIIKPARIYRGSKNLEELGKIYEQFVYSILKKLENAYFRESEGHKIIESTLTPDFLKKIHYKLEKNKDSSLILLEFCYDNPNKFFSDLFMINPIKKTLPISYSDQRPDILILGNKNKDLFNEINELLPDGSIRKITDDEFTSRYGITIIDIKNIRENKIGKKQFIEIYYYMLTLSYFLEENNLKDKFYVSIEGNGILPNLTIDELNQINNITNIYDVIIKISLDESKHMFYDIIETIRSLWRNVPHRISEIPVNIQPTCGYCYYIEDCKHTLGMNGSIPPEEWDLRLLPYTSTSIAQQLNERGLKNIGDVAKEVRHIEIKDIPEPIYPELPLLELKANALIQDKIILPKVGIAHSFSIPKYTSISLSFAIETDPANQRVYGVGLYLLMRVHANAPYSLVFDNWWKIWKDALENDKPADKVHIELSKILNREISLSYVELFYNYLKKMKKILIGVIGEKKKDGSKRKQTLVGYQYASINKGYDDVSEVKLAEKIIYKLRDLLKLCNIIENYVVVESSKAGRFFGPITSIFYWSRRQLHNFEDLLERSLSQIVDSPITAAAFESIISLFTPSDSEVKHPYQHKKLFNLQEFAETVFGFPGVLSYTWHEIAEKELQNVIVNRKYWIPHFNYMDFNNWHEFLLENDAQKRLKKASSLKRQLMFKVRTINNLRIFLQINGSQVVSKYSRVISDSMIKEIYLGTEFHSIAHVWYLFSKYTGAMDEIEVENFRTIYPEFSIGKLAAGRIKNLQIIHTQENKVFCHFNIVGLSSNMKVNEGDKVLLIPDKKRGMRTSRRYDDRKIKIKQMVWRQDMKGYEIISDVLKSEFFNNYQGKEGNHDWYLYPISIDSWSRKLYGKNGLLQRNQFGTSWLGKRLAYLWNIRSKPKLSWPQSWDFNANCIYLYAPGLLLDLIDVKKINIKKPLITKIYPYPDATQRRAINLSLGMHISGIHGPPGTGKSQTIAALIDEYLERCRLNGNFKSKILISAFSYAAIRVLIEKIRRSKDKSNNLTTSAKIQKIFLRSESQKPIDKIVGLDDIDDLLRKPGGTWIFNGKSRTVTKTSPLENYLDDNCIIFANAHQLFYLNERVSDDFSFDLIIIDEASQLAIDYFMSSLQFIKKYKFEIEPPKTCEPGQQVKDKADVAKLKLKNEMIDDELTKVIIVGDYNQLPPVQTVKPPKNLNFILESLFGYYVRSHGIPNRQLRINYRSNKKIVNFTQKLGIYKKLKVHPENADLTIFGDMSNINYNWVKKILDPEKIICSLIHDNKYEIGVSTLEADIVTFLILGFINMKNLGNEVEELRFWNEQVGVVAPHNAQGRLIIRRIYNEIRRNDLTFLKDDQLMKILKNTVYSVEKFQGSDRELIISSIGISDRDQLKAESEFIYDLNRFNVLTSRAKAKIVLIASEKFLNYIPDDRIIMNGAAQVRKFVYDYCNNEEVLKIKMENKEENNILFRYKS